MDDRTRLELRFHAAMEDVYEQAARLGYRPTRFLQMVREYGGVEAAHRLLATEAAQAGLTDLWLLGRLDLSMEYLVLSDEFVALFTDGERAIARERLAALGAVEAGA